MASTVEFQTIGKRVPKPDAWLKAVGAAQYAADIRLSGMLDGKVLRSPHPHARIARLDTTAAEALPGVKAVVTSADCAPARIGGGVRDHYALARDKVVYAGEPVAAVAAVDQETADRAVALIEVGYELLPAVFDTETAIKPGAPVVHPDLGSYTGVGPTYDGGNVRTRLVHEYGDVAAAFSEPGIVTYEATYWTPRQAPSPTEPHAALAQPEPGGRLTVWATTKAPFRARGNVAATLGISPSHVRLISPLIGGDFGTKGGAFLEPIAALLARKAHQAVRIALSRTEELSAMASRPQFTIRVKLAARPDGTIVALDGTQLINLGAVDDFGPERAERNAALTGAYRIPNVRIEAIAAYTNTAPSGHVRAPSGPQNAFAMESAVDSLARKLGMDPIDLRARNAFRDGDLIPARHGILRNSGLEACLERARGWTEAKTGSSEPPQPHTRRGVGVAIGSWSLGPKVATPESAAAVRIETDGSVVVLSGASDQGGGQWSVLTQIAAEVLAVPMDRVTVIAGDTDTTPYETGVGGSNMTYRAGNSVRQAAQDAREQVLEFAAERLGVDVEELTLADGTVAVVADPTKHLSLAEIARHALGSPAGQILGTSARVREREVREHGREQSESTDSPSFSCHVAVVAVDAPTGQITVERYFAAQDVGRAINPMGCEGQLQGGVAFGLGYALTEELLHQDGVTANANLWEYLLPNAPSIPDVTVDLVEIPSTYGPFGAKGIGEGPCIPVAAAIANAVEDAIGVRVTDIPMTPDRVRAAIRAQRPDLLTD
jgi:CO/xanthine dehydrogenase Mo-binding subunit